VNTRPLPVLLAALGAIAVAGWLGRGWLMPPPPPAPAKALANRFWLTDGGKTVLDRLTGLRWQQGYSGSTMNWAAAKDWCKNNTPALPASGWRLPTVAELHTLGDRQKPSQPIDAVFGTTPTEFFWSATPKVGSSSAWAVWFSYGQGSFNDIPYNHRVRCVR